VKKCSGVSENGHQVWQTKVRDFMHMRINQHFKWPTASHDRRQSENAHNRQKN